MSSIYKCLKKAFEKYPQSTAIRFSDGLELSRGELAALSNDLARRFPSGDGIIGLIFDSSLPPFVGLLGSCFAEIPWFPINSSLPWNRIMWDLNNIPIKVLVVSQAFFNENKGNFHDIPNTITVFILSHNGNLINQIPSKDQLPPFSSEILNDIFCIYATSGTTGTPKFVPISLKNVYCFWENLSSRFDAFGKRISMLHNMASSASLQNILLAVISGGTLCVPASINFISLSKVIADFQLDIIHIVPSLIKISRKLSILKPGDLESITRFMLGGEILRSDVVKYVREISPNAHIYNCYGPTEATVNVSIFSCEEDDDFTDWHNGIAPIGEMFPAHQVRLLNSNNSFTTGNNDSGELLLAGDQIVKGYFEKSVINHSNKFTTLNTIGEQVWYKSGDLAVQNAKNKKITVIGRVDREVKIHGFRVNPSELELLVLSHFAGISETVAVPKSNSDGSVLGFVLFLEGPIHIREKIMVYCKEHLPYYMVPIEIRNEGKIPLNSNGKIDYKKLIERI